MGDEAVVFVRSGRRRPSAPSPISSARTRRAKWMLDDPFVNFSVDLHGDGPAGSAHFGLQTAPSDAPRARIDQTLDRARERIDGNRSSARPGATIGDQNDLDLCGYQLQSGRGFERGPNGSFGPDGEAWEVLVADTTRATCSSTRRARMDCDEMPTSRTLATASSDVHSPHRRRPSDAEQRWPWFAVIVTALGLRPVGEAPTPGRSLP